MALFLPGGFVQNIRAIHGRDGEAWLSELPRLIREYADRWSLGVDAAFPNLSYNYVAPATRVDGTPCVLKIGMPTDMERRTEAEALRIYDGRGICRLLEADLDQAVALIERLLPGTSLASTWTPEDDDHATAVTAEVMQSLWRPAEGSLPTLERWTRSLRECRQGPLPPPMVDRGQRLLRELLDSAGNPVLLHGDLHHDNILRADRAPYLAIDPKGILGDRGFEVGAMVHNPDPHRLTRPLLHRRIDQLAEALGMDREVVRSWGYVHCVLAAVWTVEDAGDGATGWEPVVACAEMLG
jgi:streptomycin 6-kinase